MFPYKVFPSALSHRKNCIATSCLFFLTLSKLNKVDRTKAVTPILLARLTSNVGANELYKSLDYLLSKQEKIEFKLAKKHLVDGSLILYDVTSTDVEAGRFHSQKCQFLKLTNRARYTNFLLLINQLLGKNTPLSIRERGWG